MDFFYKLPIEIKIIIKYYTLQCVHDKKEIHYNLCKIISFIDYTNINHLVHFNINKNIITRTYIYHDMYKYNCREYSPINTYKIELEHDDDEEIDDVYDMKLCEY
mgnify:CR=1 FL=1|tara:strand:+ start:74 stop:388 length:315 start_codon:yes stop_codon:yes gene_type:complete